MRVSDFPDVARLTTPEKMKLIDLLWQEVESEAVASRIPGEQKAELDRRRKRYDESPQNVLTLEELQARIDAKRE